jgi:hypothetical protein
LFKNLRFYFFVPGLFQTLVPKPVVPIARGSN